MTKENKDLGAAPPRSLTEAELNDLEQALRAATPPPWTAAFSAAKIRPEVHGPLPIGGTPSDAWALRVAALTSREDAVLIAALRNVAPSLISDSRALLEARRLLGKTRDFLWRAFGERDRITTLEWSALMAKLDTVLAFLRSDSERSEHGKD